MRLPRIPDLLTTANLSCGVVSILLASQGQLTLACWLVFAGAAFDVLDGWAARALGGGSEFGKQLDSLADMVTFGVAPGMIAYVIGLDLHLNHFEILSAFPYINTSGGSMGAIMGVEGDLMTKLLHLAPPVIIACSSCWRLAKFNLDQRQSSGFLGMPTPANSLFWASIGLGLASGSNGLLQDQGVVLLWLYALVLTYPIWTIVLTLFLGFLMLSDLPLPSLKFKHMHWKGNEVIYLLLSIGLVLIVLYGILAVPLILLLYLLSPLWGRILHHRGTVSTEK